MCAADVTEELCASECLCVRVSAEIMNISVWVRLSVCVCMPVACWVSICMRPITCLSVLLCVLRENDRLNAHVSVQDSSLRARSCARARRQEKRLGNGVFPAVIRESIALALCTSPCLRFVHMPPLLAVGEGCVYMCVCVLVCAVLGVLRPLEGNRQILLAGLTHGNTVNNATR